MSINKQNSTNQNSGKNRGTPLVTTALERHFYRYDNMFHTNCEGNGNGQVIDLDVYKGPELTINPEIDNKPKE